MIDLSQEETRSRVASEFRQALLRASKSEAERVIKYCIDGGGTFKGVEMVVIMALERIGSDWEAGNASLSQVYLSGRICEDIIASFLPESDMPVGAKRCAIALLNDYHQLGKRIVLSALRSAGFRVEDWGRMTVDQVVTKALASKLDVLLLSTLMLASALQIKEVREGLDAGGFKGKLLVGGAPFRLDKTLFREVGADATADNAMESITVMGQLLGSGA